MTYVDAHVLHNFSIAAQKLPTAPISEDGADFIARATAYASKQGATQFPILTSDAVYNCTTTWSETVNRNVDVAASFSLCVRRQCTQQHTNARRAVIVAVCCVLTPLCN